MCQSTDLDSFAAEETGWWKACLRLVFMNLSSAPDDPQLTGFSVPYGTHRAEWAALHKRTAGERMKDEKTFCYSAFCPRNVSLVKHMHRQSGCGSLERPNVSCLLLFDRQETKCQTFTCVFSTGIKTACLCKCPKHHGTTPFNKHVVFIAWRSDGRSITEHPRINAADHCPWIASCILPRCCPNDAGEYKVVAKSSFGEAMTFGALVVNCE